MKRIFIALIISTLLYGCGTLDNKTILINVGDSKQDVLDIMGMPADRQLQGQNEAWQYCVSGAGFGYNDHKIIWFLSGKVTGLNSYRSTRSGCTGAIKSVRWEDAPDIVLETRER